jgi:hypothetical protein
MKKTLLSLAVFMALTLPLAAADATIKVINKSDWSIHHFFLSPADEKSWGPDQLGDEVLETGDSLTLTGIDCDEYDIRVVDEDGDECLIASVALCADNSVWKLTNKDLLSCQAESE